MSENKSIKVLKQIYEKNPQPPGEGEIMGACPLPEPHWNENSTTLSHSLSTISVRRQPKGYEYDQNTSDKEKSRYLKQLKGLLKSGEITQEQFDQYSALE